MILLALAQSCSTTGENEKSSVSDILNNIHGEPVVPREANKIYIEQPVENSRFSEIAEKVFILLREKLNMSGRLTVVPEKAGADLMLHYSIGQYQVQAVKFGDMRRAVQKRMRITAGMKLVDVRRDRIILIDREIQAFRDFSDIIPPIESEYQVLNEVLGNLSNRIFEKTLTGWYTGYMSKIEKGKK